MKGLDKYPPKVLIAWGEAISGKKEFVDILFDLNYPELGHFCYALRNNMEARKWLIQKGYAHLAALIEAAEGKKTAISWLEKNDFILLKHMALAIDNDEPSYNYIKDFNKVVLVLTSKMKYIKNEIEDNNQDPHKISL